MWVFGLWEESGQFGQNPTKTKRTCKSCTEEPESESVNSWSFMIIPRYNVFDLLTKATQITHVCTNVFTHLWNQHFVTSQKVTDVSQLNLSGVLRHSTLIANTQY